MLAGGRVAAERTCDAMQEVCFDVCACRGSGSGLWPWPPEDTGQRWPMGDWVRRGEAA